MFLIKRHQLKAQIIPDHVHNTQINQYHVTYIICTSKILYIHNASPTHAICHYRIISPYQVNITHIILYHTNFTSHHFDITSYPYHTISRLQQTNIPAYHAIYLYDGIIAYDVASHDIHIRSHLYQLYHIIIRHTHVATISRYVTVRSICIHATYHVHISHHVISPGYHIAFILNYATSRSHHITSASRRTSFMQ